MKLLKHKIWITGLLLVSLFFLIQPTTPFYAADERIKRLEGADRYQTAAAIAREGWETSDYAVLARGDDFADALCAGPLAAKYGAPILMTAPNELSPAALQEIKRLGVKHLLITGGTGAISANVEASLRAAGIADIRRFAGQDRYETAVQIARELTSEKAVLVTGENFPDALSISVPATQSGMPILLTRQNNLPDPVKAYLQQAMVSQTYLIGGEGVISKGVEYAVLGPNRIAGTDRYLTNIAVIEKFANELDFAQVYVADGGGPRGNEFADALAGAVLAAKTSSPLILADGFLPGATAAYLKPRITVSTQVTGLGGEAAVPMHVLRNIPDLLVTSAGELTLTPNRMTAGGSVTIDLTYTLGEPFANGTIEFIFPDRIQAAQGQYLISTDTSAFTYHSAQAGDSNRKVTISGVTAEAGKKIKLTLIDKTISQIGNYQFKVIADADGQSSTRLPNSGSGSAARMLAVHTAQLGRIHEQLISRNRPYQALEPRGIVIHSTATPGKTAQYFFDFFDSAYRSASAHYFADWTETVLLIPEQEVAWHAGPTANHRYLSIEMCEPAGKNPEQFQQVWNRTVLLAADVCIRYGWNVRDNIFSHNYISYTYHESDHTDPLGFLATNNRTWDQLLDAIDAKIIELQKNN